MVDRLITRRQFTRGATTVSIVGLVGCSEDFSEFDPRNIPEGGPDLPGGRSNETQTPGQTDETPDGNGETSDETGENLKKAESRPKTLTGSVTSHRPLFS